MFRRIFSAVILVLLFVSSAFALSDTEYNRLRKNNAAFARADKKLTQAYNDLRKSMPAKHFETLKRDQRDWIKSGRDNDARDYIREGYSRAEAYTMATNDRADALPDLAKTIQRGNYGEESVKPKPKPAPKKPEPEPEPEPDDDDDNKGEIEEDRFKNTAPDDPSGNYSRRNSKGKGGFMTIIITDKSSMEAEVTISVSNPEATWSAKGWIDDNVLELYDDNFSDCQVTLTFSGDSVKVEATKSEDWDEVLGEEGIDLSGTYSKN